MYTGHGRLCVCLSVCLSLAAFPHYCTDQDVSWGMVVVVVHYWADLQWVHGFRCYDNIAPNAKCQRVLVLAVCLVFLFSATYVLYPFPTNLNEYMNEEDLLHNRNGGD